MKEIYVSFPEGKKVNAVIDNYTIKSDQPLPRGGSGSAANPFQLFLSSIALCAGFFALEFCMARNIVTEGMALKMICNYDEDEKRFTTLEINLKLPEEFPEKYNRAIIRAMNACTVKKHLLNPPKIEISAS